MSDEELNQDLIKLIVEKIWREPEIAVAILEQLGWKLEGPAELPPADSLEPVCAAVQERLTGLFAGA